MHRMQNLGGFLFGNMDNKSAHILVIDDDPVMLHYLKIMLGKKKYEATFLSYNDESVVNSIDPDLILMDMWLGEADGKEVCKSLKENPGTSHIPLVMMSSSKEAAKKCLDAGADQFILKPFDIETLLQQITVLLPE
jgi:DNA-binding response OmpR family regulator